MTVEDQMNEQHDYVIRMTKEQLPPANAFWSMTLYDSAKRIFHSQRRKPGCHPENKGK